MDKSFSLIRTNPALTTNYKVVVDSEFNLFLESYPINRTLSEERFRKFPIKSDDFLFEQLFYFWEGIEENHAFLVKDNNDADKMYSEFKNQFDDIYFSGANWITDKDFQEEFEYNAPIWLTSTNRPEAFVIFRIDEPGLNQGGVNPQNWREELWENIKLVEYFDLTNESSLGEFLDNNYTHSGFKDYPLEIGIDEEAFTRWHGIDYNNGGWVSKGRFLNKTYKENWPPFRSEKLLSDGFRRNGVIMANILNMKFLFDDTPATSTSLRKWSLNRYSGFYLDKVEKIKSIYSYQPFELKKTPTNQLNQLEWFETLTIPYLYNNKFVVEEQGQLFSFDPIKDGYNPDFVYWIEWKGEFYQLQRVKNEDDDFSSSDAIIGKYIYRLISDKNIENEAEENVSDPRLRELQKRVLINELNTLQNQVEIIPELVFPNIRAKNVLRNTQPTFTTIKKHFDKFLNTNGNVVWGFTISLQSSINNNLFSIPNFEESDFVFIRLDNKLHVIKRFDQNIDNVGNNFYIQTDYSIDMNGSEISQWINNGNQTLNNDFYHNLKIENPGEDGVKRFDIFRASFTDIKDFDFERVITDYTKFEYEKEFENNLTDEPKFYAPEYRNLKVKVLEPQQLTNDNLTFKKLKDYLRSDVMHYDLWKNELSQYDYEEFLKMATFYHLNQDVNTQNNTIQLYEDIKSKLEEKNIKRIPNDLPRVIKPVRIPILNPNGNPLSSQFEDIWQKDWKGNFKWFPGTELKEKDIFLKRDFYREEGYKYITYDDNGNEIIIDFLENSQEFFIRPEMNFDDEYPMPLEIQDISITNYNINPENDKNYIPVSSEYITSDELWQIENDSLTDIWRKNQWVCKWGYWGSLGKFDKSYRFNHSFLIGGFYNNEPNPDGGKVVPNRKDRELDYFYRLNTSEVENYLEYSLHIKESFFDLDKYILGDFDYFRWVFESDQKTEKGIQNTQKYSLFVTDNDFIQVHTLFKNIKYFIEDVNDIIFDNRGFFGFGFNNNVIDNQILLDYETQQNNNYQNYKFSIIFASKKSDFQSVKLKGDGNFGIDVYLNDKYQNILIWIYIETDQEIYLQKKRPIPEDPGVLPDDFVESIYLRNNKDVKQLVDQGHYKSGADHWLKEGRNEIENNPNREKYRVVEYINAQTTPIDNLYFYDQDVKRPNFFKPNTNPDDPTTFSVSPRDLKYFNILNILSNPNYFPDSVSGKNPVNFIHIYREGSYTDPLSKRIFRVKNGKIRYEDGEEIDRDYLIYDSHSTDFILNTERPVEFLNKENAYKINTVTQPIDINNTIRNRIVLDDDPDDDRFNSSGAIIDTLPTLSSWDGYPFARELDFDDLDDKREVYLLNEERDPLLRRHSGFYRPVFKNIPLFRPANYYNSGREKPVISFENWKFYDNALRSFGYINELIYSKVNLSGNILKLKNRGEKSIYPMIDEYGYDFAPKFIFSTNWDSDFYFKSRRLLTPVNKYPDVAGYSMKFDGKDDFIQIPDNFKFHMVVDPDSLYPFSGNVGKSSYNLRRNELKSLINNFNSNPYLIIKDINDNEPLHFNIKVGNTNIEYNGTSGSNHLNYIKNLLPDSNWDVTEQNINVNEIKIKNTAGTNFEYSEKLIKGSLTQGQNYDYVGKQIATDYANVDEQFALVKNWRTIERTSSNLFIFDIVTENFSKQRFGGDIELFEREGDQIHNNRYRVSLVDKEKNIVKVSVDGVSEPDPKYNFKIVPFEDRVFVLEDKGTVPQNKEQKSIIQASRDYDIQRNIPIKELTVEFWMKSSGFTEPNQTLIFKGKNENTDEWSWAFRRDGDNNRYTFATNNVINRFGEKNTKKDDLILNFNINDNRWHHIALVCEGLTQKKIYVDGKLQAEKGGLNLTYINNIESDLNKEDMDDLDFDWDIFLGSDWRSGFSNQTDNARNWKGEIDELRIWNYARSRKEIINNYQSILDPRAYFNPAKSLIGYWRFDEQNDVIKDHSMVYKNLYKQTKGILKQVKKEFNGTTENNYNFSDFFILENSFFKNSNIPLSNIKGSQWQVSNANIQGKNDERYLVPKRELKLQRVIDNEGNFIGVNEQTSDEENLETFISDIEGNSIQNSEINQTRIPELIKEKIPLNERKKNKNLKNKNFFIDFSSLPDNKTFKDIITQYKKVINIEKKQ